MVYGVCIGRFQMPHLGHKSMLQFALERCDHLVILVGTTGCSRSLKNPWSFDEVQAMLRMTLPSKDLGRVTILPHYDSPYEDFLWRREATNIVERIAGDSEVILFGHHKDKSSSYLDGFTKWGFTEFDAIHQLDATSLRSALFLDHDWRRIQQHVTPAVYRYLLSGTQGNFGRHYYRFRNEARQLLHQVSPTHGLEVASVIFCEEKVLVRTRDVSEIGAGDLALPTANVKRGERVVDAVFRGLKENTGIELPGDGALNGRNIGATVLFDRADGPTQVFSGEIHPVAAGCVMPNLPGAEWLSFDDLEQNKHRFHADHFFILRHFVGHGSIWDLSL